MTKTESSRIALLASATILALLQACTSESDVWTKVEENPTEESIAKFISDYPDGEYLPDAKRALENVRWQHAKEERSRAAVELFLKQYESGDYHRDAADLLEAIDWEQAADLNTVGAYADYLSAHPEGHHEAERKGLAVSIDNTLYRDAHASGRFSINVMYEYPAASLPFLVAMEKGFLARRNVLVIPQKLNGRERIDLRGSDWDVSFGQSIQKLPGGQVFDFIQLFQLQYMSANGPLYKGFIARADQNIESIEDLADKAVAIQGSLDAVQAMFAHHGVEKDTFIYDSSNQYYLRGYAAYAWSSEVLALLAEQPDVYKLMDQNLEAKYVQDPYYLYTSFVRKSLLEENEEGFYRFQAALNDAIDFIRNEPDAAKKVIPKYFGWSEESALTIGLPSYHRSDELPDWPALSAVHLGWGSMENLPSHYAGKKYVE